MYLDGKRLKKRRIELGLSQEELAARLETTQKQIWRYESGEVDPSAETLVRLAKVLNVSVDYLLGLVDTPDTEIKESALTDEERAVLNAYWDGKSPEPLLSLWWRKWRERTGKNKTQDLQGQES